MGSSNFKIFSASAGSGKTYALTKAYLKLLLGQPSPSKFRQILAMTFTNKAVNEMKTRILEQLHAFGSEIIPEGHRPLFHDLSEELSLSEAQLRSRSKQVLKLIVHNYSFFEISTIDKFNHKVLKTFARDLRLSQNFEVELDTDLLLDEAVGNLLERAGTDHKLTEVLIAFALEKIDEDKSWDIAFDLKQVGKLLFQENHAEPLDALRTKTLDDFEHVKATLTSETKTLEKKSKDEARNALEEIEAEGFAFEDFPRQTLPNHFKKISSGTFTPKDLYSSKTLEPNLVSGKILKANDKRDGTLLASKLLTIFVSIKEKIYRHAYLKNIYGNLVPLTVLNEISKEIKKIEQERDIIPISSLNNILSKEIKNQPAPFIYERLGEKYRHYFIDEFQDTSKMQWENLIPLIGNALESENERKERGSLFLVGDAKQAIYRWRGGKSEQFLSLINTTRNPFVVEPSVHNLDTNWRSYDQIVEFNNDFFAYAAPIFGNEEYQELFIKGSNQKTNHKPGGLVQMTFLRKDVEDKDEAYCNHILKTVNTVISENYSYSDICVLVRDNNKGIRVADFLAEKKIPIISSDALLLDQNDTISFLISILRILDNEKDLQSAYEILSHLTVDKADKHELISENLNAVGNFLEVTYGFNLRLLQQEPVASILERAIVQFDLADTSVAHLLALMDFAMDVEKSNDPSVRTFLNYWEIKKSSLAIAAPEGINAVRIMTIHKAKGLEFPFVIFPFANATINKKSKKIWVPSGVEDKHLGFPEFLLNVTQDMLEYNPRAAAAYVDEEQKAIMDAMNVLYVALTRPVKGLYIITENGKGIKGVEEALTYNDLFESYIKNRKSIQNVDASYTFGVFPKKEVASKQTHEISEHINYVTRPKGNPGYVISTKSGRLWDNERGQAIASGNLIHYALSQVKTLEDVSHVIESLKNSGDLPLEAVEAVKMKILEVVNHPELKKYFSGDYVVLNEREILTPSGTSFRPDSVTLSGNRATLIDYKTGAEKNQHKLQLLQYKQLLEEMNFEIERTFIVYIDQEVKTVIV